MDDIQELGRQAQLARRLGCILTAREIEDRIADLIAGVRVPTRAEVEAEFPSLAASSALRAPWPTSSEWDEDAVTEVYHPCAK